MLMASAELDGEYLDVCTARSVVLVTGQCAPVYLVREYFRSWHPYRLILARLRILYGIKKRYVSVLL